jgi:hypothetical protein
VRPDQIIASVMALIAGTADPSSFATIRAGGAAQMPDIPRQLPNCLQR